MERGLIAPLSPHEEITLRRIALGISHADVLPARDAAHLIQLRLVDEDEGRLNLTELGRERYQGLPRAGAAHEDEADTGLRSRLQQARDR